MQKIQILADESPHLKQQISLQKQIANASTKKAAIQRKILIGDNIYKDGTINANHIPYYDHLKPKVNNKIEAWASKRRNMPFANWTDVLDTALRVTGETRATMYTQRAFNPFQNGIAPPNHVVRAGRKYWPGGIPTFVFGGNYYNSNDGRFKRQPAAGREVHATLDNIATENMRNELEAHVKAQPAWINRNQDAALYTDAVDLRDWTVDRSRIGTWHISLYAGDAHVGGWYAIAGTAVLPNYHNDGEAATAGDIASATTIHQNMNNDLL